MNKERLQIVRDRIAAAPPEQFIYSSYLEDLTDMQRLFDEVPEPGCGTAGCVAGWTCMLFVPGLDIRFRNADQCVRKAIELLNIYSDTADFLFHEHCSQATREDALKRIDYLLQYGHYRGYSWSGESWWKVDDSMTLDPHA